MPQPHPRLWVFICSFLILGLCAVLGALPFTKSAGFNAVAHADPQGIKFTGSGSCEGTASQCHSGPINKAAPTYPGDCSHNENSVWSKRDRHALAFKSKDGKKGLTGDVSKKIAANLGLKNATESERCLNCHGLSGFSNGETKSRIVLNYQDAVKPEDLTNRKFSVANGVSCDACHGPASKFLEPHVARQWTQQQRQAMNGDKLYDTMGLYDTKNLRMRANMCVSCHLKIDADLLKAGHPVLPFELDTFCHGDWMHWRPSGDYFGAKAWAMGQAVSLREAALQLAERIKGGDKVDNGLRLDSYRQLAAHVVTTRHIAQQVAPDAEKEITAHMTAVHSGWSTPEKLDGELHALGKTADSLAEKINGLKFERAQVETLLKNVAAEGEAAGQRGFHSAFQITSALMSLYETLALQGAAPNQAQILDDARVKTDPKAGKLIDLSGEVVADQPFSAEKFGKLVKEAAAQFPGGTALPLPPNAPDSGSMPAVSTAPEVKKPETPAVAEVKKPETPPVVDVKKPETPAVAEVKKPETPAVAEIKKPETPAVAEVKKPDMGGTPKEFTLPPAPELPPSSNTPDNIRAIYEENQRLKRLLGEAILEIDRLKEMLRGKR